MVAAGALGDVRLVQVEYAQDWLVAAGRTSAATGRPRGAPIRRWPGPAGCLGDIGTHASSPRRVRHGPAAERARAESRTFVPGRRARRSRAGDAALRERCARHAVGEPGGGGEENGCACACTARGGLRFDQEKPNELWFTPLGAGAAHHARPGRCPTRRATRRACRRAIPKAIIEAFAQLYRDFAADVRQHQRGEPVAVPRVPGLDAGVRSLGFIDAVLHSHRQNGAWVVLR